MGGDIALGMFRNLMNGRDLLRGMNFDYYGDMEAFLTDGENVFHFQGCKQYRILDIQYPESRFILNVRNVDDWVMSRLKHYSRYPGIVRKSYGSVDLEKVWREEYSIHHESVIDYFKNRDNLLVYDIDHDDASKIKEYFSDLSFKLSKFPRIR